MSTHDALEQAKTWLAERGVTAPDSSPPTATDTTTTQGSGPVGSVPESDPAARTSAGTVESTPPGELPTAFSVAAPDQDETNGAGRRSGRRAGGSAGVQEDADADPESVARQIVVRKLSLRAHTRAELERALQAKCVPEEAARSVLDRMAELGLIDDEVFARDWVESRQQRRHLSRRGLQQELSRRGVERETIAAAVDAVDSDDELAAARALVRKKREALDRLDPRVRYRRLAGLLTRRGYGSAVVATVLEEMLGPLGGRR